MLKSCRAVRLEPRLAVWLLAFQIIAPGVSAVIRDGGIDPANLGKGDWIYILPNAMNEMGGNVPSVTDLPSLMIFLKNQGLNYVIIKAGDGGALYPSSGAPQFTAAVVSAGHVAGVKVFGYNRSYGTDIPGEVAVADYVFNVGADGFVFDAEIEWESQNLPNNTVAASNLCSTVRAHWPNKFLAHSPFPIISYHSTFPYREFGYYCDAVMPQDYWIEIGVTPTAMVTGAPNGMSSQWNSWQNSLSGRWTNSIKPIAAAGQGWSSARGTVNAAQVTQFFTALRTDPSPATRGGYKSVNFWRAELHPPDVWDAIRTNRIGNVPTNPPVIDNVSAGAVTASAATITWTTDIGSDSAVEYGLDTGYGGTATNSGPIYYHTVGLSGLAANTTYHYRVKSRNSLYPAQQGVSGDYVFTTATASAPDVIVESYLADGSLNSNPPYSDSGLIAYSTCKSSASGLTGAAKVRYATGGSGTPSITLRPTLPIAGGTYDVYVTHCSTSCSADMVTTVTQSGCSGLPGSTAVFQQSFANAWAKVGQMTLSQGVTVLTLTFTYSSGALSGSSRMYGDGFKFSYVPPPPSAPSITAQPASQNINQGNPATFSVVASGTPQLFYQWRFKGTNIAGATSSGYTKNNAQTNDAGDYSVVITNGVGSKTSSNAMLTVNVPPSITTQPVSQSAQAGDNVTFFVTASGTAPLSYQWQFDDADIPGATGTAYTRTNVQTSDAGPYSVIVSNVAASVPSADAVLTVLQPSPPHIDAVTLLSGQGLQLQVSGGPGSFAIEVSPALSGWSQLDTLTAIGSVFQYVDPRTNLPSRFYRIRAVTP